MHFSIPYFFLKGLIIGLTIAAPVGPVGILCIHRTLQYGRFIGIVSGIGAASADLFYGAIAAFGLVTITTLIQDASFAIRLVGGLLFVGIGIHLMRQRPAFVSDDDMSQVPITKPNPFSAWLSTFILTAMNPGTIVAFTVIFATFGIDRDAGALGAVSLVAGVFIGSSIWWCCLALFAGSMSNYLKKHNKILNRISGTIIITFGTVSLISLLLD